MGKQPEGKLSLKIINAWKEMGADAWKVHGNEYTPAGTPDICGVFMGFSVWCETKMPGNKPSMIQWKRMRDLRRAGALTIVSYTLTDAVALLEHIQLGEHKRIDCRCVYTEPIDLLQKRKDNDYR